MKCISCEIDINPQWKYAIDMNVCPFCGKHIMEERLKNLFTSLRETMDALQKYHNQLDDWMLSNHNYIKADSPDIIKYVPTDLLKELKKIEDDKDFLKRKENQKFTVKVKTEAGEEEVVAEKIQSEEATNDFFKRAEVIKTSTHKAVSQSGNVSGTQTFKSPAEKTQHLKKVAQQIKKAGSQGINMNGQTMAISAEMLENADPEAITEYQSLLSENEIASAIDSNSDDDDNIPSIVLSMSNKNNKSGQSNADDLVRLREMQERQRRSKEAFESGNNRGGKGGGFSRA